MTEILINSIAYPINFFSIEKNKKPFAAQNLYGIALFDFLNGWFSEKKTLIVSTSGSTGKPKLFEVEKWKLKASATRTIKFFDLPQQETFLLSLPLDFIAGKLMVIRAIESKANLITQSMSSAPLTPYLKDIAFGAITPMQLQRSIELYGLENITKVEQLLIGGAKLSEALLAKLKGYSGNVYETFGMTETLTHIAVRKVHPVTNAAFKLLPEIEGGSENGALVLDHPSFLKCPIKSNDLVDFISEKEFIWKGRVDFIINSGGLKIQPEQIEEKLKTSINTPFAISSKIDSELGERVVLVIEGKQEIEPQLFNNLPKLEKPKSFVVVNKIPKSEAGKTLRAKLKQQLAELSDIPI